MDIFVTPAAWVVFKETVDCIVLVVTHDSISDQSVPQFDKHMYKKLAHMTKASLKIATIVNLIAVGLNNTILLAAKQINTLLLKRVVDDRLLSCFQFYFLF